MKIIKGKHCANCSNCRSKSDSAWCGKGLWFDVREWGTLKTSIQGLSSKYYKDKAKQCPEYMSMEG